MKKLWFILSLALMNSAFAQAPAGIQDSEILVDSSVQEEAAVTIKEVKALASTMAPAESCLDEYLHRRKQVIGKLVFTPVTAAAEVVGSVYGGGLVALGIATVANVDGWGALGYFVGGAMAGAAGAVVYAAYDTTKSGMELADNNLMVKALAEQYLHRDGAKTQKLYEKYTKATPESALSRAEFVARLMDMDATGTLCDGSLVKQPRFKLGFKLKYKVAKSKDLIQKMK